MQNTLTLCIFFPFRTKWQNDVITLPLETKLFSDEYDNTNSRKRPPERADWTRQQHGGNAGGHGAITCRHCDVCDPPVFILQIPQKITSQEKTSCGLYPSEFAIKASENFASEYEHVQRTRFEILSLIGERKQKF